MVGVLSPYCTVYARASACDPKRFGAVDQDRNKMSRNTESLEIFLRMRVGGLEGEWEDILKVVGGWLERVACVATRMKTKGANRFRLSLAIAAKWSNDS